MTAQAAHAGSEGAGWLEVAAQIHGLQVQYPCVIKTDSSITGTHHPWAAPEQLQSICAVLRYVTQARTTKVRGQYGKPEPLDLLPRTKQPPYIYTHTGIKNHFGSEMGCIRA